MTGLWIGIALLLLMAIGFIYFAVRDKKIALILIVVIMFLSLYMYHCLGYSQGLRNTLLLQAFNNQEEVLPELMQGLQKQLKQHPDDPVTLTLLGKIYFTTGDYQNASDVYAKAYALTPDDNELLIDYATTDFLAKDGVIDPQLKNLLDKVKKSKPTIASLSLLANVALENGDAQLAVQYWQQMQTMVPKDSELYQELDATIKFVEAK